MTFSCFTLGCKTNQAENDAVAELLISKGHIRVPWGAPADALIINTCAVTSTAEKKTRSIIRRARKSAPDSVLAVHGCMSQRMAKDCGDLEPLIDVLWGTGNRAGFAGAVEKMLLEKGECAAVRHVEEAAESEFEALPVSAGVRTRAFLKIQDGCDGCCSYCVIPSLRGRSRSLAVSEAVKAAGLLAERAKEIVLTGIEISAYRDGGLELADLTALLAAAFPHTRFRLGSLEPGSVDDRFVKTISAFVNICPHFHLSLQSGCDTTLAAMSRRYSAADAARAAERLRAAFPDCTLGCDLIVGFPGESESDFDESLAFVENTGFAFMHIFPYSRRPKTPAAAMGGQLTGASRRERAARASTLATRLLEKASDACTGRVLDVLIETVRGEYCSGHAGNYLTVCAQGRGLQGEVRRVKITGRDGGNLTGYFTDNL